MSRSCDGVQSTLPKPLASQNGWSAGAAGRRWSVPTGPRRLRPPACLVRNGPPLPSFLECGEAHPEEVSRVLQPDDRVIGGSRGTVRPGLAAVLASTGDHGKIRRRAITSAFVAAPGNDRERCASAVLVAAVGDLSVPGRSRDARRRLSWQTLRRLVRDGRPEQRRELLFPLFIGLFRDGRTGRRKSAGVLGGHAGELHFLNVIRADSENGPPLFHEAFHLGRSGEQHHPRRTGLRSGGDPRHALITAVGVEENIQVDLLREIEDVHRGGPRLPQVDLFLAQRRCHGAPLALLLPPVADLRDVRAALVGDHEPGLEVVLGVVGDLRVPLDDLVAALHLGVEQVHVVHPARHGGLD